MSFNSDSEFFCSLLPLFKITTSLSKKDSLVHLGLLWLLTVVVFAMGQFLLIMAQAPVAVPHLTVRHLFLVVTQGPACYLFLHLLLMVSKGFFLFEGFQHVVPAVLMGNLLRPMKVRSEIIVVDMTVEFSLSLVIGLMVSHIEGSVHVVGVTVSFGVPALLLGLSLVALRVLVVVFPLPV